MKAINIVIDGQPISKRRPRFARRGKFVATYSDQQTEEGMTYLLIKSQVGDKIDKPIDGPVSVEMRFFLKRPKSHYGTGRNSGKLRPSAQKAHTATPDLDNLEKFYWDIMNKLVWKDDSQVVKSSKVKWYSGQPRTEISVVEIGDNIPMQL